MVTATVDPVYDSNNATYVCHSSTDAIKSKEFSSLVCICKNFFHNTYSDNETTKSRRPSLK